jgi:rare lipoprotein A
MRIRSFRYGWCHSAQHLLLYLLLLSGCGTSVKTVETPTSKPESVQQDGPPARPVDVSQIPDAVPRYEPRSRYGNPESYVVFGRRYHVMDSSDGYIDRGIASWYGKKFHGRRTSSGETYDMYAMTAAHPSLPLPTYVQVTNLENGRQVVVKVNDRGPFHDNRIIDMSYAAAGRLGMLEKGTALVKVKAISPSPVPPDPVLRRTAVEPESMSITDRFYIQVGAFSELDNAERLRMRLKELDRDNARIHQAVVNGRTVYRVRIGPLNDVQRADNLVARLPDFGVYQHQIVPE